MSHSPPNTHNEYVKCHLEEHWVGGSEMLALRTHLLNLVSPLPTSPDSWLKCPAGCGLLFPVPVLFMNKNIRYFPAFQIFVKVMALRLVSARVQMYSYSYTLTVASVNSSVGRKELRSTILIKKPFWNRFNSSEITCTSLIFYVGFFFPPFSPSL